MTSMTQELERARDGQVGFNDSSLNQFEIAVDDASLIDVVVERSLDERAAIAAVNVCGMQFGLDPTVFTDPAQAISMTTRRVVHGVTNSGADEVMELLNRADEPCHYAISQSLPRLSGLRTGVDLFVAQVPWFHGARPAPSRERERSSRPCQGNAITCRDTPAWCTFL